MISARCKKIFLGHRWRRTASNASVNATRILEFDNTESIPPRWALLIKDIPGTTFHTKYFTELLQKRQL